MNKKILITLFASGLAQSALLANPGPQEACLAACQGDFKQCMEDKYKSYYENCRGQRQRCEDKCNES